MINHVSVFETKLVLLNPMSLIDKSGFNRYCWNPDGVEQGEPPINENEIYLSIKSGKLIPPDVFSDTPSKNQLCNMTDCSREQHVARIAWFVENMNINDDNCIEVDFYKNSPDESSGVFVSPCGGCHRLCALIYLKSKKCVFRATSGSRQLIESSTPFLGWLGEGPKHNNLFGKNILSSENNAWDIDLQIHGENNERIWVNDLNLMGRTIARFSNRSGVSSCEIYNKEEPFTALFVKTGLTVGDFISYCSEHISHEFEQLKTHL